MKNYLEKLIDKASDTSGGNSTVVVGPMPARLAIYDSLSVSPYIIDLSADDYEEFIGLLSTKTYQACQEKGGAFPFTLIREIIENLIHACFSEVIITILDKGNTVRISDQGPGIKDKDKVMEPGFSTATKPMKQFIKGVGSGLTVVKESLALLGGSISIDDNIERGTVVTLSLPLTNKVSNKEDASSIASASAAESSKIKLNKRQRQVLFLVTELGEAGPTKIANELKISLSTAYRDLSHLELGGLIKTAANGKRSLTAAGVERLDEFFNS